MKDSRLREQLEKYHQESYVWALRCCFQRAEEAKDVLQTVYLKILDGRAQYNEQSVFKTWLFAIIRKTAIDVYRRKRFRKLWLMGYQEKMIQEQSNNRLAERDEDFELRHRFRQMLSELPARQQQVLQLAFYHDLTLEQTAQVMRISLGSVRTHYERGKKRLRQLMKKMEMGDAA